VLKVDERELKGIEGKTGVIEVGVDVVERGDWVIRRWSEGGFT